MQREVGGEEAAAALLAPLDQQLSSSLAAA
jgi:hypothetical protein